MLRPPRFLECETCHHRHAPLVPCNYCNNKANNYTAESEERFITLDQLGELIGEAYDRASGRDED